MKSLRRTIRKTALTLMLLFWLTACNFSPVQPNNGVSVPTQEEPVSTAIELRVLTPSTNSSTPSAPAQDKPVSTVADIPVPTNSDTTDCTTVNPHPIGQGIAETYDVSYEQVMAWFCEGFSFENIMIALETSEAVDIPAETLLRMLLEKNWEEIWDEIGFIPRE
ncbi:MAG TPA: hypothetical protein VNK49_03890 [Anaerolineales bacterium]|nr:hypothetical protein [Anaerolineales bacterium]